MEPLIIDNFLPDTYVDSLYQLLGGDQIPWSFSKYSTSIDSSTLNTLYHTDEPVADHIQFRHIFIDDNRVKSSYLQYIAPLIACYENAMGVKVKYTQRIKSNLLMPQEGIKLQSPHIDDIGDDAFDSTGYIANRKTLLYYVNNSDGDTILYNEKYNGKPIGLVTKQQAITPVKGRAVIFDSNQIHSACIPTNKKYRLVINCVFGH